MEPLEVKLFCAYRTRELFAAHDRELWAGSAPVFRAAPEDLQAVSWRDIEHFSQQQHQAQLAATTINRRLHALKHFFDYLVMERQTLATNSSAQPLPCGRPSAAEKAVAGPGPHPVYPDHEPAGSCPVFTDTALRFA